MIDHDVERWWVRPELAVGEDVEGEDLLDEAVGYEPNDNEDVEDVLMEGAE